MLRPPCNQWVAHYLDAETVFITLNPCLHRRCNRSATDSRLNKFYKISLELIGHLTPIGQQPVGDKSTIGQRSVGDKTSFLFNRRSIANQSVTIRRPLDDYRNLVSTKISRGPSFVHFQMILVGDTWRLVGDFKPFGNLYNLLVILTFLSREVVAERLQRQC